MSVRRRTWTTPKGEPREAWVVNYFDADRVRRQKTFAKQRDARAFERRAGVEIEQGVHVADSASCTVGQAADLWLETCEANGLERSTIEAYRGHVVHHLKPLIGNTLVSKITVPAVRAFQDTLRAGGRSPAMIKRIVGSLGAILADAQERGLAAHNAVREMRGRHVGRDRRQEQRLRGKLKVGEDIPTPDEIRRFIGKLQGRWRPLLMTAAFCGLRASELRGLRWSDVDLQRRELHVSQRADRFNAIGPPKSGAGERTVPIPAMLANTLREWKLQCPRGELDLVFPTGAGTVEGLGNIVRRGLWPAMIEAGVTDGEGRAKYRGMHCLRHFYAAWSLSPVSHGGMGLAPKVVQTRMGHASIQMMFDRYGHLLPRSDSSEEVDEAERVLLG